MKKIESFQNKLLIAMPTLEDPYFSQSVVYIYAHDKAGATGFIINKPMNITVGEMLSYAAIPCNGNESKDRQMLLGGPIRKEQLFLIFYDDNKAASSKPFSLHHSKESLHSLGLSKEDNVMAFLGYAAWEPGQLERELKENSWLITAADYDLLYNVPFDQRYHLASSLMGFNFSQLSDQVGHT